MLTHSVRVLKPGGLLCLNVNDNREEGVVFCQKAVEFMEETQSEMDFLCTMGLQKSEREKSHSGARGVVAEPIFIWRKKRGMEDEQAEKERLKKV